MSEPRAGVRRWGDGTGLEILLLPSKGIENGETREHGCESMRGWSGGRVTGDWLVVGIDDKLLLVHCPATEDVHSGEASSGSLELNGGFVDERSVFLILLGRIDETIPTLLVILVQILQCMGVGLEQPIRTVGRANPPTGRSESLKETRSGRGQRGKRGEIHPTTTTTTLNRALVGNCDASPTDSELIETSSLFLLPPSLLPLVDPSLEVRVPEDDQESHEDHKTPDADEHEEHDTFLLQPLDITGHNPPNDPTIVCAASTSNGSKSNGARNLIHIFGRKDEGRLVHPRHVDMQVVVHERQRVGQRIHFGSDEAENEILHRSLEDGSTKDGLNQILNIAVEIIQSGVESGGGRVDPAEDPVVDSVLDVIDLGVDLGSVHCGLVQHVLVYGRSDSI